MLAPMRVPGPIEPQGTVDSPSRPSSATLRGASPACASRGMPMVMPMPKPVIDSAKGVMPCTMSSTVPMPGPARSRIQRASSAWAPECCSTCDIHSPPPMISNTSSTMGVQRRMAGQMASGGTGKEIVTASSVAASPSQAARSAEMPASSETMTARTGRALRKVCMKPQGQAGSRYCRAFAAASRGPFYHLRLPMRNGGKYARRHGGGCSGQKAPGQNDLLRGFG